MWGMVQAPAAAGACAAASAACFAISATWQPRSRALREGGYHTLVPHAAFRFFAFWFVMLVHSAPFSWPLSLFYWISVFVLGFGLERRQATAND